MNGEFAWRTALVASSDTSSTATSATSPGTSPPRNASTSRRAPETHSGEPGNVSGPIRRRDRSAGSTAEVYREREGIRPVQPEPLRPAWVLLSGTCLGELLHPRGEMRNGRGP